MIKKILINTRRINEIRVAFIENQRLFNIEIESEKNKQKKGNIYKGIITKIELSLDAIFVNYGKEKDGFLPFKELSQKYLKLFDLHNGLQNLTNDSHIKGKSILIQIEKEEKEGKGAALTTYLSFAGCYIVLLPNNSELEGISRHIDGEERINLKAKLNNIFIPKNMGVIIRTLGFGKSMKELTWELSILLSQFKMIKVLSKKKKSPCLIYEEGSLITRVVRDYLKPDISEIIVDDFNIFNLICKYLNIIKSDFILKVKLYNDIIPLFSKYKIESQIELIFKREIFLFSGGSIIIDHTEALTSIDVNSSKFNRCDDIEETALQTNLEAIDEIARQIRIRDLSGLIIIDFIDMDSADSQKLIEKTTKEALSVDKAKIQIEKISKFGLLEISRQRLKSSLVDNNQNTCYKCSGTGKIDNIDVLSLIILNAIEEEALKFNTYQIHAELPVKMSTYIMNIKREHLLIIEKNNNVKIILIVNKYISIPNYKIYRSKHNDKKNKYNKKNFENKESFFDPYKKFNINQELLKLQENVGTFLDFKNNTTNELFIHTKKIIRILWNISINEKNI